jgi:hypothetical protein
MKIVQVQNGINAMNFQDHCELAAEQAGLMWLCDLHFAGDDGKIIGMWDGEYQYRVNPRYAALEAA